MIAKIIIIAGFAFSGFIFGLILYNTEKTINILSEMNERQKTVVVSQHKGIEQMIRDVCVR